MKILKVGDIVEITSNIPFKLKDKPKPLLGTITKIYTIFFYIKPKYQRYTVKLSRKDIEYYSDSYQRQEELLVKEKITFESIKSYLQGTCRYQFYYTPFKWLIRKHIREQIDMRINSMNPACYEDGSCVLCGCKTTALQMANRACKKPCYPKMMNRKEWKRMKEGIQLVRRGLNWKIEKDKFKQYSL